MSFEVSNIVIFRVSHTKFRNHSHCAFGLQQGPEKFPHHGIVSVTQSYFSFSTSAFIVPLMDQFFAASNAA